MNNRHPSCQEFRERSGPRGLSHAGWSSPQSLSRTDPCPCHMLLPHKSDTKDETAPSGCKFLLLPLCGLFGTWEACVFLGQRRYVPVLVFHIDRKPSASLTGHCRLAPTCILFLPLSTPGPRTGMLQKGLQQPSISQKRPLETALRLMGTCRGHYILQERTGGCATCLKACHATASSLQGTTGTRNGMGQMLLALSFPDRVLQEAVKAAELSSAAPSPALSRCQAWTSHPAWASHWILHAGKLCHQARLFSPWAATPGPPACLPYSGCRQQPQALAARQAAEIRYSEAVSGPGFSLTQGFAALQSSTA